MEGNETKYAVILRHPELFRKLHREITAAVSKVSGIPVYQASKQTAKCGGIVGAGLDKPGAIELARELKSAGIEIEAGPESAMAGLPEPEILDRLEIGENAVTLFVQGSEPQSIPWRELVLVAAAKVEHTETQTKIIKKGPGTGEKIARMGIMVATGMPIGLGKKKEIKNVSRVQKNQYYIELFTGRPLRRLRIDASNFDYTCLKEKIEQNLYGNFRKLIDVFREKAPEAAFNSAALFYLNPQAVAPDYESLEDLAREERAILTVIDMPGRGPGPKD